MLHEKTNIIKEISWLIDLNVISTIRLIILAAITRAITKYHSMKKKDASVPIKMESLPINWRKPVSEANKEPIDQPLGSAHLLYCTIISPEVNKAKKNICVLSMIFNLSMSLFWNLYAWANFEYLSSTPLKLILTNWAHNGIFFCCD